MGRLDQAVANLVSAAAPGGTLVISVPIEIGFVGLAKLALKLAYGYDLSELPSKPGLLRRYVWALITGARISGFRDNRLGWVAHFGFDYRDLDDLLSQSGVEVRKWSSFTTRFYVARIHSSTKSLHQVDPLDEHSLSSERSSLPARNPDEPPAIVSFMQAAL